MTPTSALVPLQPGMSSLTWQDRATLALRETYPKYKRTIVAGATGVGKGTWLASMLVKLAWRGRRVVFIVNNGDLLDDVRARALAIEPGLPTGVVRARQDDRDAQVVFATSQTLASGDRAARLGKRDHIFWDEVHHLPSPGGQRTMAALLDVSPDLRITGTTATAFRNAGGGKTTGLGAYFDAIIHEYPLLEAQADGILCPLQGFSLPPIWKGDSEEAASEALDTPDHDAWIVRKHIEHGRRRGVVFCTSVAHSLRLAEAFKREDIPSEAVWESSKGEGKCPDRSARIAAALSGGIEVITNVGLLCEGWNFPACSVVHIARTVGSLGLFCQMVGRGTRLHPSKPDGAVILDYGGNCDRLNLASPSDLTTPAHRRPKFDLGCVVRHARISALAEGVIDDLGPERAYVTWRGAPPDWHPLTDLVFIRAARSAEPLRLTTGIDGLNQYAVPLARGDVAVSFYKFDSENHAAATSGPCYAIRRDRVGDWSVWVVVLGRGRGDSRTPDSAVRIHEHARTAEEGMAVAGAAMDRAGHIPQKWGEDWETDPATEPQGRMLRRYKLRRSIEGMSKGTCSALITAVACRQVVGDVLDPEAPGRRAAQSARYGGKR